MKELEKILEDLHRQLLTAQILSESLSDLLIVKGVLTKEEIEGFCNGKVEAIKVELEKIQEKQFVENLKIAKKQKNKKQKEKDTEVLTSMFMGTQIGEA